MQIDLGKSGQVVCAILDNVGQVGQNPLPKLAKLWNLFYRFWAIVVIFLQFWTSSGNFRQVWASLGELGQVWASLGNFARLWRIRHILYANLSYFVSRSANLA